MLPTSLRVKACVGNVYNEVPSRNKSYGILPAANLGVRDLQSCLI